MTASTKTKAKTTAAETTFKVVRPVFGFDRKVKNLPKRVRMDDEVIGTVTVYTNAIGAMTPLQLQGIVDLGLANVTQDADTTQTVSLNGQRIATVQIHDNPLKVESLADLARLVRDEICEVVTV